MFLFQRISLVLIIILTIQDVKPQGLPLKEKQTRQIDVSSIINGSEEEEEEEEATTTTTTEKTTTELVEYYEEEETSNKTSSTAPDLAEYEYEYYYEEVDDGNATISNVTTISPPTAENSTNEFNVTVTPTVLDETTTETGSIFRKLLLNRLNATESFTETVTDSTTTEVVTTTVPPEEHPLPVLTPEDVQVFQMIKHQMNTSMNNATEGHSPQLEPEELLLEAIMSLNAKDIETFLSLKEIHDEFVVFDIVNISKTTEMASTSTTFLPVTEEAAPPPPPTETEVTLVKQSTPTSTLLPATSTSKPEGQGIIASVRNLVKSGNFNRMGLLSLLKQTRSTVEYLEDIGLVNEFSAPLVIADDLWGGLESIVG